MQLSRFLAQIGLAKIVKLYRNKRHELRFYLASYYHRKELKKIKNVHKVRVIFILLLSSNWKYDSVYRAFLKESRFFPMVLICPYTGGNEAEMLVERRKAKKLCKDNGYNFIDAWNEETHSWIDIKKELRAHIIFFSNPHSITKKEYLIEANLETLTCYVPYSIRSDDLTELAFNSPFQQYTWINFYESNIHKRLAEIYAMNKGENVEVVGYPTIDQISQEKRNIDHVHKKVIIWAPHWTIPGASNLLTRSCFLDYYNFFLELAASKKGAVEVIFRPHPFLKRTLYKSNVWGKQRTDEYYNLWKERENLSYSEGDYIKDFVKSDLLVHDSVSFLSEYFAVGKPVVFTKSEGKTNPQFNKFGEICLDAHYQVKDREELKNIIERILKNDEDKAIIEKRKQVLELLTENGESCSELIVKSIKEKLKF
ncbi:CDP-glycerol glycerophosphotransferase family protein [Flavilitoribacter nigricans]|uniref:CDP-glycerol--glycerophosphate glycerophosphotransferase n=1 Tax=Flavilitoribacter nigricans (strain ATCC 23147 / DSM 23189 / NBRC 102662 / NCIMB 1420 / SS-2) TaxID=1122177 RepID=A0A2D0MYZ6_FLAN2|nr:CDP-glycerol glycerophosphotransferase family protein [Flavilitoribacter nigricans]PHN01501.1 hypothetical protein CRP01_36995 [Flavilitoribacter nigricans DSM 23189 = NBRC 102662]